MVMCRRVYLARAPLRTTLLRSTSSVPSCSWLQGASNELGDACKMDGQRGRSTRGGQIRVTEAFPSAHEFLDTGTYVDRRVPCATRSWLLLSARWCACDDIEEHHWRSRPWGGRRPPNPHPRGVCGEIARGFHSASHKVFPLVPKNRARLPDGAHRLWVCVRAQAPSCARGSPRASQMGGHALALKGVQT